MDFRLWRVDLKVRQAFANMLRHSHQISEQSYHKVNRALREIEEELEKNLVNLTKGEKDSYNYVRRRLIDILGEDLASILYIGASKNEQTTLKLKIWTKYEIKEVNSKLASLIQIMTTRVQKDNDIIMPSYMHLQKCLPTRWSHWLLSHAWHLCNDIIRMEQMKKNYNLLPLGINFLSQAGIAQNLHFLSRELGFQGLDSNDIHSIKNRDFISEFLFSCLLISIHLGNLAKDINLYSSPLFKFINFRESHSSRKLDTIRCISSLIIGNFTGIMLIFKGIPSAYDKDVKLVNIGIYDTVDQMNECLLCAKDVLLDLEPNIEEITKAVKPYHISQDMIANLIRMDTPYSKATEIVQRVFNLSQSKKCSVFELDDKELLNISDLLTHKFMKSLEVEKSLDNTKSGGANPNNIENQVKLMETLVAEIYKKL